MKIGLFSDLHLEHRDDRTWQSILDRLIETARGVDLLINAGDTHHDALVREWLSLELEAALEVPIIEVLGNHDFYGNEWSPQNVDGATITEKATEKKFDFLASSLWTDFDGDSTDAVRFINDFGCILNVSPDKMTEMFRNTLAVLEIKKPDLVFTHFAPSKQSVHPRFAGDSLNSYFCPDAFLQLSHAPKLWLHGHVHDPVDYVLENTRVTATPVGNPAETSLTRVVGNPLGYPGETYRSIQDYSVRVIEV